MKRVALACVLLNLAPGAADANTCFGTLKSKWELLVVRQAFDGGTGEGEPGRFGYIDPGSDSKGYWLFDAGIRTKECELNRFGTRLLLYPSFEWHHTGAEPLKKQDETNQIVPSANAEWWFADPTATQVYLVAKGKYIRDLVNDVDSASYSLFFSAVDGYRLHPGVTIHVRKIPRAIYFPYVGIEYFDNLAITFNGATVAPQFDGATLSARINFETYPFGSQTNMDEIKFVFGGEYAYRRTLDDEPSLGTRDLNFVSLKATYYFDTKQTVGVTLSFDGGKAPTTNFVNQRRAVFALAIKR
jgi:hypothetical protein